MYSLKSLIKAIHRSYYLLIGGLFIGFCLLLQPASAQEATVVLEDFEVGEVELLIDTAITPPRVTTVPRVEMLSASAGTVIWQTDLATISQIILQELRAGARLTVIRELSLTTVHSVLLSLQPGKRYGAVILSSVPDGGSVTARVQSFTTPVNRLGWLTNLWKAARASIGGLTSKIVKLDYF